MEITKFKYRDECKRINLYLTQNCNRDCEYCVIHNNNIHPIFDYDGHKKLVEDFRDERGLLIHIYGGEPLIHPDIINIVNFFIELECEVVILTNADFIEKFYDLNVSFITTFHPKNIKFSDFIKKITPVKNKIASISYMHLKDIRKSINEFNILLKLFNNVVFWPVINPHSSEKGHSISLEIPSDVESYLIDLDQDFFRLNKDGISTFHVWRDLGLFVERNKKTELYFGKKLNECPFMGRELIEVYNNHIFKCSAELQLNIGPDNFNKTYHISEYPEFYKNLQNNNFACNDNMCISFDYEYMIGDIK
jgi:organic radical activating enzyme